MYSRFLWNMICYEEFYGSSLFQNIFKILFHLLWSHFFLHLWNVLKLWRPESESDSILVLFRGNSDSLCQVYCHFRNNMKNNLVVFVIMTMIHAIYKYKWPYFQALVNECGCHSEIIFCERLANVIPRYNITSPLIGWLHTQNDPCH